MYRHNVIIESIIVSFRLGHFGSSVVVKLHILCFVFPPWPLPGRAVLTSLGVVLWSSPFSKLIICRGNVEACVCPGRHSPLPLSTVYCGGPGDIGESGVPHHGVAVRALGVWGFCLGTETTFHGDTTKLRFVPNETPGSPLVWVVIDYGDVSCVHTTRSRCQP